MNDFSVIYKILHYLQKLMDTSEPDYYPVTAAGLGISEERWKALIEMIRKKGYIEGVTIKRYVHEAAPFIVKFEPRITYEGLEYLQENSLMKKAADIAKGLIEIIT